MPCSFLQERLSGRNDCATPECVVTKRCFLSGKGGGGNDYYLSLYFRAVWNGRNLHDKKANQSHYRPEVPRGFQEIKVPRFHDNGTGWW